MLFDAELVMTGNRPLFLPANGGREVFYTYIQAAVRALFGLNLYTLRLVSALAGTLTVPAMYLLGAPGCSGGTASWLAAFTALALGSVYWHIHFSHYGIRVILMPLLLCGVFGFFWLGMHGRERAAHGWWRWWSPARWPGSACGPTRPAASPPLLSCAYLRVAAVALSATAAAAPRQPLWRADCSSAWRRLWSFCRWGLSSGAIRSFSWAMPPRSRSLPSA